MKSANIQLETLVCPSCMLKIDAALKNIQGVEKESINVSFNTSKAKLNFDDSMTSIEEIEQAIAKVGFEVKKSKVK